VWLSARPGEGRERGVERNECRDEKGEGKRERGALPPGL